MNPNIAEAGRATRIKPGEVRNPKGRPPSKTLKAAYRLKIGEHADDVAEALMNYARKGSVAHAKELGDRAEGPPKQTMDINDNRDRSDTELATRVVELAALVLKHRGEK